jgi:hypothetical protein
MNSFKRLAIEVGVITAVIGLLLWFAHKRGVSVIPPNTDATISLENDTVTIDVNNERTRKYAPKGTKIVVNKDGSLRVISKQYGLTRELGIGLAFEDSYVMPALDIKLVYYMRFGLNAGLGVRLNNRVSLSSFRPYAAISYALPFSAASNTSLFVGHSLVSEHWITGLSVRF